MEATFNEQLSALIKNKNHNCVYINENQYNTILQEVCEAKSKTKHKSDKDYRRLHRYDIILVGKEKKLISPLNDKNNNIKYFVSVEKLFEVIHKAHLTTGHGGRNRMIKEINEHYKNVTVDSIMLYLSLCEACQRKAKNKKRGLVVKPILSSELNSRCQVDLIDLQTQPDGDYKFVLNYQDHLTKFVLLKPLKTKTAAEVANHLMEIFTTFGAPSILQSDNGREFVNKIISELTALWDGIKIIHGKPRHSQSQGSIERANQDVENMLFTWLESNKSTKWSEGLKYVQLMKNRSYHDGIKQTPYEALFGTKMKLGLKSSSFPSELIDSINTEEELTDMISTATTDLTEQYKGSDGGRTSNEGNAASVLEELPGVEIDIDPTININEMEYVLLGENEDFEEENVTCASRNVDVTISGNEDVLANPKSEMQNLNQDFEEETVTCASRNVDVTISGNEDVLANAKSEMQKLNQDFLKESTTHAAETKDNDMRTANMIETSETQQIETGNVTQENYNKSEISLVSERKALIQSKRHKSRENLNVQAKKMRTLSEKKFPPAKIGDSVKVPIPEVDRGKTDARNLLCIVMSVDDNKYYKLGTKNGMLKQKYTRNQFTVCNNSFLSFSDVPGDDSEKSLREIVSVESLTGGQGFKRCNCKSKCQTKKCSCKASNILCNSKCHGSGPCGNKN